MAGTDSASPPEWSPDGPAMILVAPQMGENIGAAARAMWNFGLRRMRLVAPRDGWPNPAAVATASGAGGVLDEARLFETTEAAVADLTHVFATTARPRGMTKTVMPPAAAAEAARAAVAGGGRTGFLFGAERAGLANADVVLAEAVVTVPVNPAFASLNLAQCVLLIAYEWRKAIDVRPEAAPAPARSDRAAAAEVGRMLAHLEAELDAAGFFHPPDKKPSMQANLRNLFRRAGLTERDVRTLRGVIRALAAGRGRG